MLLSLLAFSLVMIAVVESLSHTCRVSGGVVFAEREFDPFTIFTYYYLPTVFAVCYSMLWGWVDLDAKRLEPYFQLSKAAGASASQSINLHYPFDLVILPPVRAVRLR